MEKNIENDIKESNEENMSSNNINCDTPNLQDLLNNFNSQDNDISQIFNNFSKGDLGDAIKQFTNIIKTSQDKSENNINNLDNLDNLDNIEQDSNNDDFDGDFELNLDKYFISKDGENICDVLSNIKSELQDIKFKL